jgi:hypothetical protein
MSLNLVIVIIIIMNNLKKALLKDDVQKYKKNQIEISKARQSNKWKELDDLIECVSFVLFRELPTSPMLTTRYRIQYGK